MWQKILMGLIEKVLSHLIKLFNEKFKDYKRKKAAQERAHEAGERFNEASNQEERESAVDLIP